MDRQWAPKGFPMDSPWLPHGLPMESLISERDSRSHRAREKEREGAATTATAKATAREKKREGAAATTAATTTAREREREREREKKRERTTATTMATATEREEIQCCPGHRAAHRVHRVLLYFPLGNNIYVFS